MTVEWRRDRSVTDPSGKRSAWVSNFGSGEGVLEHEQANGLISLREGPPEGAG